MRNSRTGLENAGDGRKDAAEQAAGTDGLRPEGKSVDSIRFRLCRKKDPYGPEVHWEYVLIFINGEEILDLLKRRMSPSMLERYRGTAGYAHNRFSWLYRGLTSAFTPGTYAAECGFEILCCGACGEPGCSSPQVDFEITEESVVWNLGWRYGKPLRFRFDREQYLDALEDLRRQGERKLRQDTGSRKEREKDAPL